MDKEVISDLLTIMDIESVLMMLRPAIKGHGGDLACRSVENNGSLVKILMKGACVGCPASFYTFSMGVESAIKNAFPIVKIVEFIEED